MSDLFNVTPEYEEWKSKLSPEVEHVHNILSNPLSDEPSKLIEDLINIEAWNSRMGTLLAQADSWLDAFRIDAIPPKEGNTEAERKVVMDARLAPIRLMRDTLEKICDSMKQKLILGESIMSYYKTQLSDRKSSEHIKSIY